MLDELRDRIITCLSQNHVCVISTSGTLGTWAVSAQYDSQGLKLNCLLPHWSDVIYHIEQDPRVIVTIVDACSNPMRWLQFRGTASVDRASGDGRYLAVHITPERVDLMDESRGWGARETLEL